MENEAKYYNAFALVGEIGPVRFKKLLAYFKKISIAWSASEKEIIQSGIEENIAKRIIASRAAISPDAEWEKLLKDKISAVISIDPSYPALLGQIYAPPAILYFKGDLKNNLDFPLGVVGSRKISSYGRQAAADIVGKLANSGITIVSGMAAGVDTASHEAALAGGGKTIAVLGSGLDSANLLPKKYLAEKIIRRGALISEFPFGMPALKHHFPLRNRIIAGLSRGVLIIEAAEKSGALITAKFALSENREVFAIPGSIYWPNSAGANNLIKSGAKAITKYEEVLEELDLTKIQNYINNKKVIAPAPEEKIILESISAEPLHIDEISKKTKLPSERAASILMLMEMKGMVKNLGGGNYVITR